MGVALAIGAGAAASAAGSIFSGVMGAAGAAKSAAAMRYAADKAEQTALTLNNRSRADLQPFRDLGVKSSASSPICSRASPVLFNGCKAGDIPSSQEASRPVW